MFGSERRKRRCNGHLQVKDCLLGRESALFAYRTARFSKKKGGRSWKIEEKVYFCRPIKRTARRGVQQIHK